MLFKKNGSRISRVILTEQEKRAFEEEIVKQSIEKYDDIKREFVARILWVMHERYRWGAVRLHRLYEDLLTADNDILSTCELAGADAEYYELYKSKLLNDAVDIEEWENEIKDGKQSKW